MKKKLICLVLILCAALILTACQQQETFPNQPRQDAGQEAAPQPQAPAEAAPDQQQIDFDDGSVDPLAEEVGQDEPVGSGITPAPTMKSEYAGPTPVKIDPVDKPTPTPLPKVTFSYATYTANNMRLTFEEPAGWLPDDSAADTYTLSDQNTAMDYPARVVLHTVNVGKSLTVFIRFFRSVFVRNG